MKRKIVVGFFIWLFIFKCGFSQNQNSIWCFGDSAGIDFSNIFNPITFFSGVDGRGSCSSIADSNGNLLFYGYTNVLLARTTLMDANHDTMSNSDPMTGDGTYNEMTLITKPGFTNQYYVFYNGPAGLMDSVYYGETDMTLNGGLGAAISKNVSIGGFRPADCVQAIKHGNGRDWWVIFKYSNINATVHNRFYVYLVTPLGIANPIIQNKGNATDVDLQKIVFNSTGNKFMQINLRGYMCEYNFNRCTGIINSPNIIYSEQTGNYNRLFWEGAYSDNDSVFYATTSRYTSLGILNAYLLQFDLTAANIPQSCDTLDSCAAPIGTGAVRLAPDGKIYYSRAYEYGFPGYPYPDSVRNYVNENLSVINYPDSLGTACDFQSFSFYLGGKRTYYGLPNNPNYNLGPLVGSSCDSLTSVTEPGNENYYINIFPNPATTHLTIQSNLKTNNTTVTLHNTLGEQLLTKQFKEKTTVDVSHLPQGIYFVTVSNEKERITKKVIKEAPY